MASGIIVVSTFYSRRGAAEKLATVAAVGAVQARANIRMRRVADPDPAAAIARYPDAAETLRRMHKEYVAPKESDLLAAHVLIVSSAGDVAVSAPEWAPFVTMLRKLHAEGKLGGKVGAVAGDGDSAASFRSLFEELGLRSPSLDAPVAGDAVTQAMALGRAAVAAAM